MIDVTGDASVYFPAVLTIEPGTTVIYKWTGTGTIAGSGAQVKIYGPSGNLLNTVYAPGSEAGTGDYWWVANVDGATGSITIINQISDTAPSSLGGLELEAMPPK